MDPSYITELRLKRFKSFRDATLPLEPFTLLVGRNGSGKSNALDALWVLSRLALGDDIRESLDGGREGPAVRGGAVGCAPFGESSFEIGCSVRTGGSTVRLDVTVQVDPVVQIVAERLAIDDDGVLRTDEPRAHSGDIVARWANGLVGPNPKVAFRATRLLTTQVPGRIPATNAGPRLHAAADQVLSALRSVFVLDPIPHEMRQYVPRRDLILRRTADNISAAVADLIRNPATKDAIRTALGRLNEQEISDIEVVASNLDDVMLALREGTDGHAVPARLMSDGSLRFLAVLAALMQAPSLDQQPDAEIPGDAAGQTTVVIEELENGLHASQAGSLIRLVRDQVHGRRVRAVATAHSPALLDAFGGDDHGSVVVCQRDRDGRSTLTRLVDLPDYFSIVAAGTLGRAAMEDRLRRALTPEPASSFLDELLGESVG